MMRRLMLRAVATYLEFHRRVVLLRDQWEGES